jgi:hypothetical protein
MIELTRDSDSEVDARALEADLLPQIDKLLFGSSIGNSDLERPTISIVPSLKITVGPTEVTTVSELAWNQRSRVTRHSCWWDEMPLKSVIKIYVQPRNGKTLTLEVDLLLDTIGDVRSMAMNEMGSIPPTSRLFLIADTKVPLDESRRLSECSIKSGEFLYLRKQVVLTIRLPRFAQMTMDVDLSETVANVKAAIEEERGIAVESQHVSHMFIPLEDRMVLRDCGIFQGSVLTVRRKGIASVVDMSHVAEEDGIQVMVRLLSGKTITVFTRASEQVADLKTKIETKAGLKKEFQRLLFSGKQLDDKKTLTAYNIRNGSTIILTSSLFSGEQKKEKR